MGVNYLSILLIAIATIIWRQPVLPPNIASTWMFRPRSY
ncbi:hypothetical protein DKAM_1283 [Desulfurococcus amylolyticus 1221n]|uniref:Uncharacterized protein n=1 Tax=Desulfurococcus amylolyticus (strain DSM 18924 / JCM 16383 / VKM B-2413 / 1221n) TaxID=490899 RepID=B8D678_DESA1|nr:hypothetical protein DKAM_1283 [Desulfurococcus amylolyticus 1221n]